VIPAASLAVIVRLLACPAVTLVAAALNARRVAAPEATVTLVVELVLLQLRQWTVTVYWYVPAESPESVHDVTAEGDEGAGQLPPGAAPFRLTS
jgi:hypothetical protein